LSSLVFQIGQIGDTIVALPAFWAIRKQFPKEHLTLLSDRQPDRRCVSGVQLLEGTGIFQSYLSYPASTVTSRFRKAWHLLRLAATLRAAKYDRLIYLVPSLRSPRQIVRDRSFFRLAGITDFVGMDAFPKLPGKMPGQRLPKVACEADLLLARLAASGVDVPEPRKGCMDLKLGATEKTAVDRWLRSLPSDGGRVWIGVGPGSKMPAKIWPFERFREAVDLLITECDVWPVVFGGPEDKDTADQLIRLWQRGYNGAGALPLRPAAQALSLCSLYLGNDTGTMHLAAAVGCPCVAIFSAREWPGMWHPYGAQHRPLRAPIDCEGCGLTTCMDRGNECLKRISVSEVFSACRSLLTRHSLASIATNT